MAGQRARQKLERPEQILEAAFEEFSRNGYAATRLEDIAARVGVAKGTIYFYFENKERLFETMIQGVAAVPLARFNDRHAAWTGDIARDMETCLRDLYAFVAGQPRARETLRLLVAEAKRFPDLVEAYFERFMDVPVARLRARLADAAARGEIRAGLRHLTLLAEVVLAPALVYLFLLLMLGDRRGFDPDQRFRSHLGLLLGGLLPDGRAPDAGGTDAGGTDAGGTDTGGTDTGRTDAGGTDAQRTDAKGTDEKAPDGRAPGGASDPMGVGWAAWRRFPDPARGGTLTAPIGPGLYELRLAGGEPLLLAAAPGVAARLAALLPPEGAAGRGAPSSRRAFLAAHRDRLEYRSLPLPTERAAREAAAARDTGAHRLMSRRSGRGPETKPD